MKQAAVMLVIRNGMILGVSRKDDPTKFGLPGGKCEPNEASVQAAIREAREETGIKVVACQPIVKREALNEFQVWCYWASMWEGEPISQEGTVVAWLTEDELTSTKAAFPDYNHNALVKFKELHPTILKEVQ